MSNFVIVQGISGSSRFEVSGHLLDFLQPDEQCSSVEFCQRATVKVDEIHARGALPLLVGGSSLLVQSLLDGWRGAAVPPNPALRAELSALDSDALMARLQTNAPQLAARTDCNPRRLIRALELAAAGATVTPANAPPPWQSLIFVLWLDPELLRARITARAEQMWESGFLTEVEQLAAAGATLDLPAMEAHGYREALRFLRGELSREAALGQMIINTCRYAKRQVTWLKRYKDLKWIMK